MGTLGIIGDRVCILCANLGAALAHAQNGPPVSSRIPQHRCMRERQHSHGVRTTDGLELLLAQGALSFEAWTHRAAPREEMRAALRAEEPR